MGRAQIAGAMNIQDSNENLIDPATSTAQTDGSQLSALVDPADATRKGEFDNLFQVPVVITAAHHEIHEGDTQGLVRDITLTNTGDVFDFLISTPTNGKQMHLIWDITGDAKFKIYFYKTPTVSANGTDITSAVFNHNGNSATTTSATIYHTPTVTNVGTLLYVAYIDKFTPIRKAEEFVLNESDTYMFRIEALKDNATIGVNGIWYEHTPE